MGMTAGAQGELPNLDLLRAWAVLLVLVNHGVDTCRTFLGLERTTWAQDLGRFGVLLFFVHTCFVLAGSMHRMGSNGATLTFAFYVRRAFRIYPLSLVCIGLVLMFGVPRLPWEIFQPPTAAGLASNLALTMNLTGSRLVLGPLWTLPIEVQMYLVLPFIFVATRRATDLRRIAVFYGIALAAAWVLPLISGRLYGAIFAPCFLAGVIAYALRTRFTPRIHSATWPLFLVLAAGSYVVLEELIPGVSNTPLQIASCLLVGLALPNFVQSDARALNRVAAVLARYSYGIYLFHCVALWIGFYWIQPTSTWGGGLCALLVLLLLSVAGYHLVEAPAIRFGARASMIRADPIELPK
jgi:peptidoglycan/LPS O-acetylase OafA/YrhL